MSRPHKYDLVGQRFGKWTVVRFAGVCSKGGQRRWLCRCDCGTERVLFSQPLRKGYTKSCSCAIKSPAGPASPYTKRALIEMAIDTLESLAPELLSPLAALHKKNGKSQQLDELFGL